MAKGKNLNPADAYRKSLRKKELKKNKAERSKARDFALVKKDTGDLEDEIQKLDSATELSASDRARLTDLKSELKHINKKKEEYVKEHPEQRKLVYRPRRQEKAAETQHEEDDDDDEDIPMPPGPPPGNDGDSDDDIPMPEGPPPNSTSEVTASVSSQTLSDTPDLPTMSPLPPPPPIPEFPLAPTGFPPGLPNVNLPLRPMDGLPPPLPGFLSLPPPPPGFPRHFPNFPPHYFPPPPPPPHLIPPPPPRHQSASVIQDPLSSIPHQTFQAHRTGHPSYFSNPTPRSVSTSTSTTPSRPPIVEAATVVAAPQLRDFKKEATAFVPTSIKRKNAKAASSSLRINAAPSVGDTGSIDTKLDPAPSKPDLLGTLKEQFGHPASGRPVANSKGADKKDDYAKFVEEMDDILGPVM